MSYRHTDLAMEAHELWQQSAARCASLPGVTAEEDTLEGFALHRVHITTREGADALGKPPGHYLTLELDGLLRREENAFPRAVRALAALLAPLLPPEGDVLVAGLGSRSITPDLIGPLAAEHTLVTRHLIRSVPEHFGAFRSVAALTPGVLAATGMESALLVQAAAAQLKPVCVIAIDALAARSVRRLCRTVQITDVGIVPGSGVGNHRMALNRETLGVPVIAVGAPTVVDGATLVADLLGDRDCDTPPFGDLFVTPREVDSRVADLSRVIGYGVSTALHPGLSVEELDLLLS